MTKFGPGNEAASKGGRARAEKLDADRRRKIAQSGLQGLADRRFGGDVSAAAAWLSSQGGRVSAYRHKVTINPGDVIKIVTFDIEGRCLCPFHGVVEEAEYEAQNPAPCGCTWVNGPRGLVLAIPENPIDYGVSELDGENDEGLTQ